MSPRSSAADTAHRRDASLTNHGGSAATSPHPSPPCCDTPAWLQPACGAGESSASTAQPHAARHGRHGGLADLLDHPAPPFDPASADNRAAGAVVDPPLPPAGPPVKGTSANGSTAASGRELLSPSQVFSVVDLAGSWARLRTAARVFSEVQQARKRIANQVSLTKTDGTPRKDADKRRAPLPEREAILSALDETEKVARRTLRVHWRAATGGGPFAVFVDGTPGLSWFSVARLFGETGHPVLAQPYHWEDTPGGPEERVLVPDPLFVRTQREWLAFCGYGDPGRQRRAGMSQTELFACGNTRAKTAAWLIATTGFRSATGKVTKAGQERAAWPWRGLWDDTRDRYVVTHPEWKPWRRKAAADRVMTKAVLVALYRAAWDDVFWRLEEAS